MVAINKSKDSFFFLFVYTWNLKLTYTTGYYLTMVMWLKIFKIWVRLIMFNATFNNFSAISWRSVLLVEETGEKTTDLQQITDKFITQWYIEYTSPCVGFELTTLVVIGTDWIGSRKSNYHMYNSLATTRQITGIQRNVMKHNHTFLYTALYFSLLLMI
jgi:hypothetical protein